LGTAILRCHQQESEVAKMLPPERQVAVDQLHEEPISGYCHPLYVRSLAEFGEPRELPSSHGWLLERGVPGNADRDAMGCYPLFSATNWAGLSRDLAAIGPSLVSVALVADPFGEYLPDELRLCFDKVVAFKEHHVVDFSKPLVISRHHRYYSRKAAAEVKVEAGPPPDGFAEQWSDLYASLVQRHGLKGVKAFSRASFELQMKVPGMVVFRAIKDGALVGAHLWYVQQNVAYSHLAVSTERGYELNCSYAIHSAVVEHFRSRVRCVDLGGGAGTSENQDGLTRFKAGWANSARSAYFCGRILNPERYDALAREVCASETHYFPAYRRGELA
jgi:hypothetical protein